MARDTDAVDGCTLEQAIELCLSPIWDFQAAMWFIRGKIVK